MNKLFLWGAMILYFSACNTLKASIAMHQSTDHFLELLGNPRIKYEPGAENLALEIASFLDKAIETAESKQYAAFPERVVIYVPSTLESFVHFCASEKPRACVIGGRLFISPRLIKESETIPGILTHELSHLHFSQTLGRWVFQNNLPSWFSEGMAVFISEGAGAEQVSKEEALMSIKKGMKFIPKGTASLLFPQTANDFGLSPQMFYRQTSLFIEWFYLKGPEKFENLITQIQEGYKLDKAIYNSYGFHLEKAWSVFLQEL